MNNTPSVNHDPSVLIVSGETAAPSEIRKSLEDMYNLGLTHAADVIEFSKGLDPTANSILNAVIAAINSLKKPSNA